MRASSLCLFAFSCAFLVTGCDPSFSEGEKSNKAAIHAGRDEVTLRLAGAAESGGDLANAERMYQQMAKSSGNSKESVIQLAGFYSRHNKAPHAAGLLEEALAKSPGDADLMRALANNLINADNPQRALSLLDQAADIHKDDAYIYNSRGVALDRLGRYGEARESYRRAIALKPEDEMDFKTNMSMSYILSGEYGNAIELLSPLQGRDISPEARQNLALAYGLNGDMESAMRVGSKDLSIKEMNENIRFYQMLARKPAAKGIAAAKADPFPVMDNSAPPSAPPKPEDMAEAPKPKPAPQPSVAKGEAEPANAAPKEIATPAFIPAEMTPQPQATSENIAPAPAPPATEATPELKAETAPAPVETQPSPEHPVQQTTAPAAAPEIPATAAASPPEPKLIMEEHPAVPPVVQNKPADPSAVDKLLSPLSIAKPVPASEDEGDDDAPANKKDPASLSSLAPSSGGPVPQAIAMPTPPAPPIVEDVKTAAPKSKAARKQTNLQPREQDDEDDASSAQSSPPAFKGSLPTPVLKPDNW